VERVAYVTCDGCLPPRHMVGFTAEQISQAGWKFDDLDAGPHLCPSCARRPLRAEPRRRTPPHARPALPNLLVIGAGKCGTTSLHRYLGNHPQIHMSELKELRFFQDPECLDQLDRYATFFNGDAQVRGESSPTYTAYPRATGVPERIRAAIPDVKLIYLVRDPVERTIALHVQRQTHGIDLPNLGTALGDGADPYNEYVAPSRYAMQLERYLRLFPREQIQVIDQADLRHRRRETLRDVFRFLDVDENFWSPSYEAVHNPAESKVRWTPTSRRLSDSRVADLIRRTIPPAPRRALFAPVKRATTRRVDQPVLDHRTRRLLHETYKPDVERLRELTGNEFASWQV
jgi:hypothetical protein